ncbi:MAG: nucleotidyltransferase family protein [Eubacteriales bacterium]|nr:nucleotidyltransferase family protein [Eubacteriales bacterium]
MNCVILAAGYATRLYPLTENFPKPLLSVGGKTILDRLMENIAATGRVERFVIVSNHRFAEIFEQWEKERTFFAGDQEIPVEILDDGTSSNETRLGAVRDLELAVRRFDRPEDTLVLAGDNLVDFSFEGFLEFAHEKQTSCVMVHEERVLEKQRRTAIVTFDENHKITSYEEKPENPKGIYAVPPFYCYSKEDIGRISEALDAGISADAPGSLAAWLSKQTPMHAYEMPGKRYDIGTLESYQKVKDIFSDD